MSQPYKANEEFIDTIYHEQQFGALCAVHCVNCVLQQKTWTSVMLAEIGKSLDKGEEKLMKEKGEETEDFKEFKKEEKSKKGINFDDAGYFSIQVITKALEINGIDVINMNKKTMEKARKEPEIEMAFICNLNKHWFTLRRFGKHWFDLNSTKKFPEYVSTTYLSLYIDQLLKEGYNIFVCRGKFPLCKADKIAKTFEAEKYVKPSKYSGSSWGKSNSSTKSNTKYYIPEEDKTDYSKIQNEQERKALRDAIALSKITVNYKPPEVIRGTGMTELEWAIQQSIATEKYRKKKVKEEKKMKKKMKIIESLKKKYEKIPVEGEGKSVILIVFKTGDKSFERKFYIDGKVSSLYEFILIHGFEPQKYVLEMHEEEKEKVVLGVRETGKKKLEEMFGEKKKVELTITPKK